MDNFNLNVKALEHSASSTLQLSLLPNPGKYVYQLGIRLFLGLLIPTYLAALCLYHFAEIQDLQLAWLTFGVGLALSTFWALVGMPEAHQAQMGLEGNQFQFTFPGHSFPSRFAVTDCPYKWTYSTENELEGIIFYLPDGHKVSIGWPTGQYESISFRYQYILTNHAAADMLHQRLVYA